MDDVDFTSCYTYAAGDTAAYGDNVYGGAVYLKDFNGDSAASFEMCAFKDNIADILGNDLYFSGKSTPVITINPSSPMDINGNNGWNTNFATCSSSPSFAPCNNTVATNCKNNTAVCTGSGICTVRSVTCLGGKYCAAISVANASCSLVVLVG